MGHLQTRLTYEQLNVEQFVLGFLRSVQFESSPNIRANMEEYLRELMQNVCDQGWVQGKGAHSVVLSNMEDGIVTWHDLKNEKKIRKIIFWHLRPSLWANRENINPKIRNWLQFLGKIFKLINVQKMEIMK